MCILWCLYCSNRQKLPLKCLRTHSLSANEGAKYQFTFFSFVIMMFTYIFNDLIDSTLLCIFFCVHIWQLFQQFHKQDLIGCALKNELFLFFYIALFTLNFIFIFILWRSKLKIKTNLSSFHDVLFVYYYYIYMVVSYLNPAHSSELYMAHECVFVCMFLPRRGIYCVIWYFLRQWRPSCLIHQDWRHVLHITSVEAMHYTYTHALENDNDIFRRITQPVTL